MNISDKFQETMINVWKDEGAAWLLKLPELIKYFSNKWQLQDLKPFENLTYSYVVSAYSALYKMPVVLKMMASHNELLDEQKALEYYGGRGYAKLLAFDIDRGAILIEAIVPGTPLSALFPINDDKATDIVIEAMKRLHQAPISAKDAANFPSISNWLSLLEHFEDSRIPGDSLKKAQTLAKSLLSTQDNLYLLHGDLHHHNILLNKDQDWILIDPKGIVGELAFEVGAFLRNPFTNLLEKSNAHEIINNRLHLCANGLQIDFERLLDWGYVQSVLTALWAVQDNLSNLNDFLKMIKLFEKIKML
jgi:streptomycin 6-kinase